MRRAASVAGAIAAAALCLPASALAGTLTPSPVAFSATEGHLFSGTVATVADSANEVAGDLSANVAWGDGSSSLATIAGSGFGPYTVSGSHTYNLAGVYAVTVTVLDSVGPSAATLTESETVGDASLTGGIPNVFAGTGGTSVSGGTRTAMAAFESAIGGADNGVTPAEQNGGFRRVNWDDVKLDGSDPGSTSIASGQVVAIGHDREQSSGLELPGPLAVANDGFVSVNAVVTTRFGAFSDTNIAAPFNSNQVTIDVVAPSSPGTTPVPQATRGLGLVFLNVVQSNVTRVQYMSGGAVLATLFAPVGGIGQPSFVGAVFPAAVVTSVVVTLGQSEIFSFDGSVAQAGAGAPNTLVAADDLVLAEPANTASAVSATAGVQFSGMLDTFTDADPNGALDHYTASIDWGDGARSAGAVAAGSGGGFTVSGSHTYGDSGVFEATVTETDVGGATRSQSVVVTVGARATVTSVSCSPSSLVLGSASTCTATVVDTGAGALSTPTGTVSFAPAGVCTLPPTSTAGMASCQTTYTPAGAGTQLISASYSGDEAHASSSGSASLVARNPACTLHTGSGKLAKHGAKLRLTVECQQAASVRVSAVATIARKGKHRGSRVTVGSVSNSVRAGHSTSLTIKPSSSALRKLRGAAGHRQKISLAFSLTGTIGATSQTKASATLSRLSVAR